MRMKMSVHTRQSAKATVTMHRDRIKWHVQREGHQDPYVSSLPLASTNGDYMALLSDVVNMLNDAYDITEWAFNRA